MARHTNILNQIIRTATDAHKALENIFEDWDDMADDVYKVYKHTDYSIMDVHDNLHDAMRNLYIVIERAEKGKIA